MAGHAKRAKPSAQAPARTKHVTDVGTPSAAAILKELERQGNPDALAAMARFGLTGKRYGVKVPVLRKMARGLRGEHALALELWRTGNSEARILAAMIDDPKRVTSAQMDRWARDFDAWDVCDQTCLNLFDKTPLAWGKIAAWSESEREFVKRAAFALIAVLAWHAKTAEDAQFIALFPIIRAGATDERNYVKKAVNWALRGIGKRNKNLNRRALELAREIGKLDSKSARWVASDAIRELSARKF